MYYPGSMANATHLYEQVASSAESHFDQAKEEESLCTGTHEEWEVMSAAKKDALARLKNLVAELEEEFQYL